MLHSPRQTSLIATFAPELIDAVLGELVALCGAEDDPTHPTSSTPSRVPNLLNLGEGSQRLMLKDLVIHDRA